jgi:hypothetical protein
MPEAPTSLQLVAAAIGDTYLPSTFTRAPY